jgi:hypothetical protein
VEVEKDCAERGRYILVRASILLTTTAHPTALAEAGTSYSQIAVKIGNNFIELEINNAVEIIFPLIQLPPVNHRDEPRIPQ